MQRGHGDGCRDGLRSTFESGLSVFFALGGEVIGIEIYSYCAKDYCEVVIVEGVKEFAECA